MHIAVPQLALAASAASPHHALLCQSRSVTAAASSDHNDERIAMELRVTDARGLQLVLAAVKSELAVLSPAAEIHGAVLHHDCRAGFSEK